jgi:hypothetical protein
MRFELRATLRKLLPLAALGGLFLITTPTALACGGLVAPNGAIRLSRATTLVAWHDGVEHYMTSFTYEGDVANLGWIVPLPAVPDTIEEGGAWTLQRLFRETHPIPPFAREAVADAAAGQSAEVLQQVKVEALNITVLRGTGQAVVDWCAANQFTLDAETRGHLLAYAAGSPIFMAAKYDTEAARARNQLSGDGAPVLITMHTAHPWVPLEVLALDGQVVHADIYLLTDTALNTSEAGATLGKSAVGSDLPGAPGFRMAYQAPMSDQLYHDLSTDRNMSWVRPDGWLTYLSLDAPEEDVTYDLGVTSRGVIRLAPYGTAPMAIGGAERVPTWLPLLAPGTFGTALGLLLLVAIFAGLVLLFRPLMRQERKAK